MSYRCGVEISGGSLKPARAWRLRGPMIGESTVRQSTSQPDASACWTRSRVKARSDWKYSWNQRGEAAAAAIP
jgi:hypothetical protein